MLVLTTLSTCELNQVSIMVVTASLADVSIAVNTSIQVLPFLST
jgi:hypothetical protein